MGSIGYGEILLIILLIFILFGPEKLPELGKAIGKAVKEFKKAESEVKNALGESFKSESANSLEVSEKDSKEKQEKNG